MIPLHIYCIYCISVNINNKQISWVFTCMHIWIMLVLQYWLNDNVMVIKMCHTVERSLKNSYHPQVSRSQKQWTQTLTVDVMSSEILCKNGAFICPMLTSVQDTLYVRTSTLWTVLSNESILHSVVLIDAITHAPDLFMIKC